MFLGLVVASEVHPEEVSRRMYHIAKQACLFWKTYEHLHLEELACDLPLRTIFLKALMSTNTYPSYHVPVTAKHICV